MEVDYKFQVEYAKSNRSSCNLCKSNIKKDSLRLAVLVQSPHFDGKIPRWFHYSCFFSRQKVPATNSIKNFDSIRFEDQQRIRDSLQSLTSTVGKPRELEIRHARAREKECLVCEEVPEKNTLVVSNKVKKVEVYHVECFIRSKTDQDITAFPSYLSISAEDREKVDQLVADAPTRKRRASMSVDSSARPAKLTAFERKMKEQSDGMWEIRQVLEQEVKKDALIGLLEFNRQFVPTGPSALLDALSDAMYFGALKPCPECVGSAPLAYKNGYFGCTGMANEWARCMFKTLKPARRAFGVPKEYNDVPFLASYKCKIRERFFATEANSFRSDRWLEDQAFMVAEGPFESGPSDSDLENCEDIARVKLPATEIIDNILKLGGRATKTAVEGVYLLSSPDLLEKYQNKKETTKNWRNQIHYKAEKAGLQVLDFHIIVELMEAKNSTKKIAVKRPDLEALKLKHALHKFPAHATNFKDPKFSRGETTVVVKGGAVVDPDSGLEKRAHVIHDSKGRPLNAVLNLVDPQKGFNSFYKLQVLASGKERKFYVFRSWGRIGTTIGGSKLEHFSSAAAAQELFENLYLDKCGNEWGSMKDGTFVRIPGKFYPLDLVYEAEDLPSDTTSSIPSQLHPKLFSLMQFLFDIKMLKDTMLTFNLDLEKMPLGQISKRQIKEAYEVLNRLMDALQSTDLSANQKDAEIRGASTQFFTLLPHDFGMQAPPLLNEDKVIQKKLHMLEDLLDIEIAYELMRDSASKNEAMHPLDDTYRHLNTNMKPLDPDGDEFAMIRRYMTNTHGSTHTTYQMELLDAFDLERKGENDRFQTTKKRMGNTMLLWHGSRRANWGGILSQGLRIAPPEAPVSGYMFGKGIYFADVFSKSANYCYLTRTETEGCLLLCEVALGRIHECLGTYQRPLSPEYDSRMGLGRMEPDRSQAVVTTENITVPCGEMVDLQNVEDRSLLYNEYIVYNVDQVKQKYLVRVKFTKT